MELTEAQKGLLSRRLAMLRNLMWEMLQAEFLAVVGIGPKGELTVLAPDHLRVSQSALNCASKFCDAIAIANNRQDLAE